jgi:hypothetical protein
LQGRCCFWVLRSWQCPFQAQGGWDYSHNRRLCGASFWNSVALLTCRWPNHIQPWNSVALLICASSYKLWFRVANTEKLCERIAIVENDFKWKTCFFICFHQDLCSRLQICSCNCLLCKDLCLCYYLRTKEFRVI